MGGKDAKYQVIYRGEQLEHYHPGEWVFFQRPRECGGGYWFGRTYDDCYWLEFDKPVSLRDGLEYILIANAVEARAHLFDDDFELLP